MKSVIFFLAFFSIFGTIGLIRGLQVRMDPEVVHKLILAHIVPEKKNRFVTPVADHAIAVNPRLIVELDYFCAGRTLLTWDVESKQLSAGDEFYEDLLSNIDRDERQLLPFPVSTSQAMAFLAGSSGAWGIKDLAQYSEEGESSRLKELAAAIVGGFAEGDTSTGYLLQQF
jgi:hypothetical protein